MFGLFLHIATCNIILPVLSEQIIVKHVWNVRQSVRERQTQVYYRTRWHSAVSSWWSHLFWSRKRACFILIFQHTWNRVQESVRNKEIEGKYSIRWISELAYVFVICLLSAALLALGSHANYEMHVIQWSD